MRILTDCEHCGEPVGIVPTRARLLVFRSSAFRRALPARLGFDCPVCAGPCESAVTVEQQARLVGAGVEVAELEDPRDRHPSVEGRRLRTRTDRAAPPFTEDDVRVFHELLSSEDWFAALLAAD